MGTAASANGSKGASAQQTKGQEAPKKEDAPKLVVNEKDTLVIEIGTDGEALERGCAVADAEQIFVVIDPRQGNSIGDIKFLNDASLLRNVMMGAGGKTTLKIFVLVPSTTSSKAHLMNAHIAAMWLGHWAQQNPCFIRTDDYYHAGDKIMKAMAEGDKRVYPAEEAGSMKAFIEAVATCLWPKRAYLHWGVGKGLEEGECNASTIFEELGPLFCAEQSLARIGDAPPKDGTATLAVNATDKTNVFLAFSEDSAGFFGEKGGVEMLTVTEDHMGMLEGDGLEGELGGIGTATANPVLMVGPADLVGNPVGPSLFVRFLGKFREIQPSTPICVVVADESLGAFKENLWMVNVVHHLIENADMVIFATNNEVPSAFSFFTKTRYEKSYVAYLAMYQLIAFPRLHFYTLGTALEAELEDKEIFFPAVTVGPPAGNAALPPVEKFMVENNPFIFPGFSNHERVVPGADGFEGASLIVPCKLLTSIFSGVCDNLMAKFEEGEVSWVAAFGEDFEGTERVPEELSEAMSNLRDLCSEFNQYLECNIVDEDQQEEE